MNIIKRDLEKALVANEVITGIIYELMYTYNFEPNEILEAISKRNMWRGFNDDGILCITAHEGYDEIIETLSGDLVGKN